MSKFDKKIPIESVPNGQSQLPCAVAIGGLSVNLNHLKRRHLSSSRIVERPWPMHLGVNYPDDKV